MTVGGSVNKAEREVVTRVVSGWRDNLVNLSGTNRLLNFNVSKSSAIPIKQPDFDEVLHRLSTVSGIEFIALRALEEEKNAAEEDSNNEVTSSSATEELLFDNIIPEEIIRAERRLLGADLDRRRLSTVLSNLAKKSRQTYLDTGLQVLYLALGQLKWNEPEDPKGRKSSPLILLPVDLHQSNRKSPVVLTIDEFEPVLNPALILKMKMMDIYLPELGEGTPAGIAKYLTDVKEFVQSQPGWSVTTDVVLSYFTFHKEAMYQDLEDNMSEILESKLVQALALSGTDHVSEDFLFEPISEENIDIKNPPERSFQVLDADASQRAAIQAASEDKTFVLDGPPGTGKSQTIANIIANQIALGKKVLFVSEKIAALEVVKNRLDGVGLGSYLLELHSHKATRQTVAKELGYALKTRPTANGYMSESDTERLEAKRLSLSAYAAAMNRVRESIGMSVHDAIGEVSLCADLPKVRGLSTAIPKLDARALAQINAISERLSSAWRPALEGDAFLWRGVTTQRNLDVDLDRAISGLNELQSLYQPYFLLASELGWAGPNSAPHLVELLDIWDKRPTGTPTSWLTSVEWSEVKESAVALAKSVELIRTGQSELQGVVGDKWLEFAGIEFEELPNQVFKEINRLKPSPKNITEIKASQLSKWIAEINDARELMMKLKEKSQALAMELGLLAPNDFEEIRDALKVQELTESEHRPEKSWLRTEVDSEVARGIEALRNCHTELNRAQLEAEKTFTTAILSLNPEELISRFANQHRGLRKMSAEYRADKKVLRESSQPGISSKQAVTQLPDAKAWVLATRDLEQAEQKYASLIGPRYEGNRTDWDSLATALETARQIVSAARTSGLDRLMENAGYGEQANPKASALAKECDSELVSWEAFQVGVLNAIGCEEIGESTTQTQEKWLAKVEAGFSQLLASMAIVNQATSRDLTLSQVIAGAGYSNNLIGHKEELASKRESFASLLEEAFDGEETDLVSLSQKIEWTQLILNKANMDADGLDSKAVREISDLAVQLLLETTPSYALSQAFHHWEECRDVVINEFELEQQLEIISSFAEWDSARELLQLLIADDSGQQEWLTYKDCIKDLGELGFDPVLEDAQEQRIPANLIPKIIFRETLKPWIDHELKIDKALRLHRQVERDELVNSFARLDRRLVETNVAKIVQEANEQRPGANLGQAKVIQSQSELKRGHLPIRHLLGKTSIVAQALKPVFMMSPLSVSQFLDPSIRFDVVIFDEASQVLPEDAVNCIYRADSFIIAGDDKQLPPTNFFGSTNFSESEEEEEGISAARDFESILSIAKGSGAFTNLTLKWHYRSRNEDLITFSNNRFYGSELITFPSSALRGPDVGVEFFLVSNGIYSRGTARSNLIEARRVADRIEHHFDTRPNLSLGVIALSQSQASAIDLAKEELLDRRPDLENHFDESRLDGFFVKNLESVQGDERDVLIFSIGYGRDLHGKFTMNFGPMSGEGGWRRLNVAVTRARQRNEVIASFLPGDIAATENRSTNELRRYLDYAFRGVSALGLEDTGSLGGEESPFEESVSEYLRSEGYEVTTQVGSSGYRIDMAINRPDYPGQFVLGIECDGAAYHSSKTARDRDRLREEVLVGLGWRLHRIWGTAWYRNRREEQERLRVAVESALATPTGGLLANTRSVTESRVMVEDVQIPIGEIPLWVESYTKAIVQKPSQRIDPSLPDSIPHLVASVQHIVEVEGPVHVSIVEMRLREGWNINRIGNVIRGNMGKAISKAKVHRDGDFLVMRPLDKVSETLPVRMHTSETRREIAHVHDREIADAAWRVTKEAVAIDRDELAMTTARYLGFTRLRQEAKEEILRVIDQLIDDGWILEQGDQLIFNDLSNSGQ